MPVEKRAQPNAVETLSLLGADPPPLIFAIVDDGPSRFKR